MRLKANSKEVLEKFTALAKEAEQRLGDFNPQDLANTAWAFATLSSQREHCCCCCFVSVSFGALIIFLNLVSKI